MTSFKIRLEEGDLHHLNEIETVLDQCLVRLGIGREAVSDFKKVDTGKSGAVVIEVHIKNKPFILKFTSCQADKHLYANAEREYRFYDQIRPFLQSHVPEIAGKFEEKTFGVGLFMQAYRPAPASINWSVELIVKAIKQMASIHAVYWNKQPVIEQLVGTEQQYRLEHQSDEIGKSAEAWRHVYAVAVKTDECPIELDITLRLLENIRDLSAIVSELPCTLFHMDNCLIDESDEIIIADWQSPGMASGPAEIGYFWARAELSGRYISADIYLDTYLTALNDRLPISIDRSSLERIVHAKRLFTHLFWSPRYVLYWPEAVLQGVLLSIAESSRILGLLNDSERI